MKKVFGLNHQYFDRLIDLFPGIDNEQFLKIYSNRDKTLLTLAGVTRLKGLIQELNHLAASDHFNAHHSIIEISGICQQCSNKA